MTELKDWLNSINDNKKDLSEDIKSIHPLLSIVVYLHMLIVYCMQTK